MPGYDRCCPYGTHRHFATGSNLAQRFGDRVRYLSKTAVKRLLPQPDRIRHLNSEHGYLARSSPILSSFSVFGCSAVQSFGALNVCCPNASDLVGARFKLLSAGAGSKHGDLCNEQIRDSNERSNLSCGFCRPKRH